MNCYLDQNLLLRPRALSAFFPSAIAKLSSPSSWISSKVTPIPLRPMPSRSTDRQPRQLSPTIPSVFHLLHSILNLHPPLAARFPALAIIFLSICLPDTLSDLRPRKPSSLLRPHRTAIPHVAGPPRAPAYRIIEGAGHASKDSHLLDQHRDPISCVRDGRDHWRVDISEGPGAEFGGPRLDCGALCWIGRTRGKGRPRQSHQKCERR